MSAVDALPDLRWGYAPVPAATPGFDPAGDARALIGPDHESPAAAPIPGLQVTGSLGPGQRYVLRVPDAWNGALAACGTPAMRSEFANDAIFSDFLLDRGYAFVSSNKGVPYNAVIEPAAATPDRSLAYPVPFDVAGARTGELVFRSGALVPQRIPVAGWHEDYAATIRAAKRELTRLRGAAPVRTYAVGLSIGGGQVRWLLERHPELADGGVEWAAVRWHPEYNPLAQLPAFLRHMPTYVASGYTDRGAHDAILDAGFPPDRLQDHPFHASLWDDHYSNLAPFYNDFTTFAFGLLLDPDVTSSFDLPLAVRNPVKPDERAFTTAGFADPNARGAYVPSARARDAIEAFAQTGRLQRPLIGIAGDADVFITPELNALGYLDDVVAAGCADRYALAVVEGGTHVDAFVELGYGLQPQWPFVLSAFDRLVAAVEGDGRLPDAGVARLVDDPDAFRSRMPR